MPELTPAELAAERAEWKERERKRREERDAMAPREHPWRRFTATGGKGGFDLDYVPPGYSGLDTKWW